ncbi:MAG TPA: GNAT family protein [bacterium]|jgi:RimJ/RimL family protein N-acetyltransferase|nr:GNAT family N-acetyltransferase [Dictyoglomota bacterium]HHV81053.1 GNAT family N-acetyltransferase [bacterium]HOK29012.1 GNAT family protein [bacterium]HOL54582.1 GNAT family protein [bacterium]HON72552.1 GNAT family protein [bacterium]
MENPFLVGDKIYFRGLELDDLDKLVSWINDPEVTLFLTMGRIPLNSIREEEWVRNLYKNQNDIVMGIVLKDGDQLIGDIGLHKIDWVSREGTLGIMIGEKEYQNKGYGTEAVLLMLNYAFEVLNLNRIELTVFEFNKRAIRCYEKGGFTLEGRLREKIYKDGMYRDVLIMSILKDEWKDKKGEG